jgi:hypothetical protein
MQAVRQIYADLPESIITPIEFRHRKVEIIILPLDDIKETQEEHYHVIEINNIVKLSREELHER